MRPQRLDLDELLGCLDLDSLLNLTAQAARFGAVLYSRQAVDGCILPGVSVCSMIHRGWLLSEFHPLGLEMSLEAVRSYLESLS